jgi:hypothetical protein
VVEVAVAVLVVINQHRCQELVDQLDLEEVVQEVMLDLLEELVDQEEIILVEVEVVQVLVLLQALVEQVVQEL